MMHGKSMSWLLKAIDQLPKGTDPVKAIQKASGRIRGAFPGFNKLSKSEFIEAVDAGAYSPAELWTPRGDGWAREELSSISAQFNRARITKPGWHSLNLMTSKPSSSMKNSVTGLLLDTGEVAASAAADSSSVLSLAVAPELRGQNIGRYLKSRLLLEGIVKANQLTPAGAGLAHSTMMTIEGLSHGGAAETSRRLHSAYSKGIGVDLGHGSPWRGIVGISGELMNIFTKGTQGVPAAHSRSHLNHWIEIFSGLEGEVGKEAAELIPKFQKAIFKGRKKGMIFVNKNVYKEQPRNLRRSGIVHERVHAKRFESGTTDMDINVPAQHKSEIDKVAAKAAKLYGYEHSERWAGPIQEELLAYAHQTAYLDKRGELFGSVAQHRALMHVYRANPIANAMQNTTNMVKANLTSKTVPGLAQSPVRGGSRQGPQGGT